MKEKTKWNDYDALPLILDVTDIQHMTVPCIHRWKTYRAVFRFLIEIAGW